MQILAEFLGFTSLESSLWNTASYLAFIIIIIGVFWQRGRNWLITLGAAALGVYAMVFLRNTVLATLQIVIVFSGILQLSKTPRRPAMFAMVLFTMEAYIFLILMKSITNLWSFIGSLGLLGIAFGLIILPKRYGFLIMAAGGLLLVAYSFVISAWVFFFLNIFFFVANIHTWRATR